MTSPKFWRESWKDDWHDLSFGKSGEDPHPQDSSHTKISTFFFQGQTRYEFSGAICLKKSPQKSRKSLPGPGPKSLKKVSKKVRKVKKRDPAAGDFFGDLLAFGPETPSPRSTEAQG